MALDDVHRRLATTHDGWVIAAVDADSRKKVEAVRSIDFFLFQRNIGVPKCKSAQLTEKNNNKKQLSKSNTSKDSITSPRSSVAACGRRTPFFFFVGMEKGSKRRTPKRYDKGKGTVSIPCPRHLLHQISLQQALFEISPGRFSLPFFLLLPSETTHCLKVRERGKILFGRCCPQEANEYREER